MLTAFRLTTPICNCLSWRHEPTAVTNKENKSSSEGGRPEREWKTERPGIVEG